MKKNRLKQISREIMQEIEGGELKMKPRSWFVLQKIGVLALFFLSFVGVGVALSIVDVWLRDIGGAENLWGEFGEMLWEDFPVYWVTLSIILAVINISLYGNIGDNYKKIKVVKYTIAVAIIVVLVMVMVLVERRIF